MTSQQIFAGIDIGGTNIKFGLVDREGNILYKEHRPSLVDKGADPLMHLVTNIAETLLFQAAEEDHNVQYLGVGTPGAVDHKCGKVIGISPNIDGWQGMEIGRNLSDRLNMPVKVENDVNAMALAESRFGAAVGYDSVLCVALGTGVGGGIVLGGKLWRGHSHSAGELGHISLNLDGPECRCGSKGCIEAYCSSSAIVARAKKMLGKRMTPALEEILDGSIENISIKKLFLAAKKGDETARLVIEETASYLGIGLSGVVNLLNPEVVVIGGGIADAGGGFVEAVSAEVRNRAFKSATENLRITKASLGNDAGFIGAGILDDLN